MGIFFIQTSNPAPRGSLSPDSRTLEEVIEDVFPLHTEDAYMCWNGVRIGLSYKYDVSTMCRDAISMLQRILSSDAGATEVVWPSSSFHATWKLRWADGRIWCEATWHAVTGNIEEVLDAAGPVELAVDDYLAEWGSLLAVIERCLVEANVRPDVVEGYRDLVAVRAAIDKPGILYRAGAQE